MVSYDISTCVMFVSKQNSVEDLISQLTDASKHQNRIINTFQNANKRLRTENEEQRNKYTELQQHIDAMKTKEASKIIKEQKVQTDLQSQLSATELKLDEAERTIQRMTMEKEDKERKINQLETNLSELRKLESRIYELNRETRLLKRRIDTVCKEKDSLQRNADSVEQERDKLKLRIDSLIAQKCSAGKSISVYIFFFIFAHLIMCLAIITRSFNMFIFFFS